MVNGDGELKMPLLMKELNFCGDSADLWQIALKKEFLGLPVQNNIIWPDLAEFQSDCQIFNFPI